MAKAKRSVEPFRRKIDAYYKEWASYLGVEQTWQVSLSIVPRSKMKEGDSAAEATWPSFYRSAKIKFNADWLKEENPADEDLESTVVHELCHLVYADSWDFINEQFSAGKVHDTLLDQEERNVDILTRFLMRRKYEHSGNRPSELLGSPEPKPTELSERLWASADDSGVVIRPSGTSTATGRNCRRSTS